MELFLYYTGSKIKYFFNTSNILYTFTLANKHNMHQSPRRRYRAETGPEGLAAVSGAAGK
jgi:hypothetical protein